MDFTGSLPINPSHTHSGQELLFLLKINRGSQAMVGLVSEVALESQDERK